MLDVLLELLDKGLSICHSLEVIRATHSLDQSDLDSLENDLWSYFYTFH